LDDHNGAINGDGAGGGGQLKVEQRETIFVGHGKKMADKWPERTRFFWATSGSAEKFFEQVVTEVVCNLGLRGGARPFE
jgi:hypothetical protein